MRAIAKPFLYLFICCCLFSTGGCQKPRQSSQASFDLIPADSLKELGLEVGQTAKIPLSGGAYVELTRLNATTYSRILRGMVWPAPAPTTVKIKYKNRYEVKDKSTVKVKPTLKTKAPSKVKAPTTVKNKPVLKSKATTKTKEIKPGIPWFVWLSVLLLVLLLIWRTLVWARRHWPGPFT